MLIVGVLMCIPIFFLARMISHMVYDFALPDMGEDVATKFADFAAFGFYICGYVTILCFAVGGLIFEERKGYRRIIAKLESQVNRDTPSQSVELNPAEK